MHLSKYWSIFMYPWEHESTVSGFVDPSFSHSVRSKTNANLSNSIAKVTAVELLFLGDVLMLCEGR